jgi:phospholipid transport system transporter-binding protein
VKEKGTETASFDASADKRARVVGALEFPTVSALLPVGSDAIERGEAAVIDLAGVKSSDSSGLALLIEWLSVAKTARCTLRYENVPSQLRQLARLSEVEELLPAG